MSWHPAVPASPGVWGTSEGLNRTFDLIHGQPLNFFTFQQVQINNTLETHRDEENTVLGGGGGEILGLSRTPMAQVIDDAHAQEAKI